MKALNIERELLINHGVFDVFLSAERHRHIAINLRQSLDTVLATKRSHYMADVSYERANKETGAPEWRIWRPCNKPISDENGEVGYIIHATEDVTSSTQLGEMASTNRYLQTIINQFKEPLQILQPVFGAMKLLISDSGLPTRPMRLMRKQRRRRYREKE